MTCRAISPCPWDRIERESALHKSVQHHTKSPRVGISTIILLTHEHFGSSVILASTSPLEEWRFRGSRYVASKAKVCKSNNWVRILLPVANGVEGCGWEVDKDVYTMMSAIRNKEGANDP
jgi:hypothetical protein